jgi:hypothetical protein
MPDRFFLSFFKELFLSVLHPVICLNFKGFTDGGVICKIQEFITLTGE